MSSNVIKSVSFHFFFVCFIPGLSESRSHPNTHPFILHVSLSVHIYGRCVTATGFCNVHFMHIYVLSTISRFDYASTSTHTQTDTHAERLGSTQCVGSAWLVHERVNTSGQNEKKNNLKPKKLHGELSRHPGQQREKEKRL